MPCLGPFVPAVLTALVVTASTASAFVCPSPTDIAYACKQLNISLHSRNIEGVIKRCIRGLNNPYDNSSQYPPDDGSGTRHFHGTTYYGGSTQAIDGITRIIGVTTKSSSSVATIPTSSTPASRIPISVATVITRIQSSASFVVTSTVRTHTTNAVVTTQVGTTSAQPIVTPTGIPITTQSKRISGGAIVGAVLRIFGFTGLLGWCWRRGRAAHVIAVSSTTHVGHARLCPCRRHCCRSWYPRQSRGWSAYASRFQPFRNSTGYTSGSNGHITSQSDSNYNTTAFSGGNPTTTGSGNASQSGDNSTIHSSNNGYNPKSHN
ncbi:hypothetical protein BGZ47_007850 [Haplosporangium gracile]|nr:hypothetical protein BGZ47_007850 [Haplosporangium gracile]